MSNKKILIPLTFIPIIIGYLINRTIMLPHIGILLFYVLPFIVLIFWYWLGRQYAKTNWKPISAILIGNMTGALSLAMYFWQFVFTNDESRSSFFAVLSQMFSAAVPTYLFGRIAMLFETQPNYAGRTTMVVMQIMAVMLMIIIFSVGYFKEKKHNQYNSN